MTYNSRFGGYQKDLPDMFYNHGKILNILNTPIDATDCLKVCFNIAVEGYTEKERTRDKLRGEKGILVDYNAIESNPDIEDAFDMHATPFPIHDIPLLARALQVNFNILKLHHVTDKKYAISTLYTGGYYIISIN